MGGPSRQLWAQTTLIGGSDQRKLSWKEWERGREWSTLKPHLSFALPHHYFSLRAALLLEYEYRHLPHPL